MRVQIEVQTPFKTNVKMIRLDSGDNKHQWFTDMYHTGRHFIIGVDDTHHFRKLLTKFVLSPRKIIVVDVGKWDTRNVRRRE